MNSDSAHKWLISTVVPVYNVQSYLVQTLDSVIAQTIGFEDKIQLIIIDDGSNDGSANICKDYERRYPANITYVRQENSGVSAARNCGMRLSKGKYLHFLDSDDIISNDFYTRATKFLEENDREVDFVAAKIKFFDGSIDAHPNNYKFEKQRVIYVDAEPDNPIMHVSSCLFIRESIGNHMFDTKLRISEDAKFIADILEQKRAYGVLKQSALYYRKRSDNSSAINGQFQNRSFYTGTPKRFLEYLLNSWSRGGRSSRYAQCVVLYDLHWRLQQKSQTVLTSKEESDYKNALINLIKQLDDELIVNKRGMSIVQKCYILSKKYGKNWQNKLRENLGAYYLGESKLFDIHSDLVYLDFIRKTESGKWLVEGYALTGRIHPKDTIQIRIGDKPYNTKWTQRSQLTEVFLGEDICVSSAFYADVVIDDRAHRQAIEARYITASGNDYQIPIQTNRFTGMSVLPLSYRHENSMIFRKEQDRIAIYRYGFLRSLYFELRYLSVILLNWRLHTLKERLGRLRRYNLKFLGRKQKLIELVKPFAFSIEAIVMIPRAFLLRTAYHVVKPCVTREIWLIGDRGMAAGDNGEALYRYILRQSNVPADVYFVIARKSADYSRIKSLGGKVVDQNSLHYKLLFLLSSKVISSQADVETTNPFIRQIDHYDDLFRFDYVFLQHGIIRHDLSVWLNRFEKDIKLFVTSARVEHDSILALPYYYSPEKVLLSGLPRYDYLESDPKNKLILAPTYRKNLAKIKTDRNGARRYDSEFKTSDYRNFYNDFMNDPKVLESMRSHNIKGELYLHPVFSSQVRDFNSNERFTVKQFPYNYAEAFRDGSMMVSDFSSVMFDFAYLKKPVVYSQFDEATFFASHTYDASDFFIDRHDGFGPIADTYDALVNAVVKVIEDNCRMEDIYKKRVDDFFYKRDKDNSKRVYEAILKMNDVSGV